MSEFYPPSVAIDPALTAGTVTSCWGHNGFGQLGDGSTTNSSRPVAVAGLIDATALAAGNGHTCGLLHDGSVSCWGWNDYGQLGEGRDVQRSSPGTVMAP